MVTENKDESETKWDLQFKHTIFYRIARLIITELIGKNLVLEVVERGGVPNHPLICTVAQ